MKPFHPWETSATVITVSNQENKRVALVIRRKHQIKQHINLLALCLPQLIACRSHDLLLLIYTSKYLKPLAANFSFMTTIRYSHKVVRLVACSIDKARIRILPTCGRARGLTQGHVWSLSDPAVLPLFSMHWCWLPLFSSNLSSSSSCVSLLKFLPWKL